MEVSPQNIVVKIREKRQRETESWRERERDRDRQGERERERERRRRLFLGKENEGEMENLKNMKNMKMPKGGGPAAGLGGVLAAAGLGLYTLSNCLFNVEGGKRAIVFNRVGGIKDQVSK